MGTWTYWLDGIAGIAYLLDDEHLKAKVPCWTTSA
jgi:hypothetical protein